MRLGELKQGPEARQQARKGRQGRREFTKGGLVKGGLAIVLQQITHKLLNPPLQSPPLWTPEAAAAVSASEAQHLVLT